MIWWTSEMKWRSSSSTVEERTCVSTKGSWEKEVSVGLCTSGLCNSYFKDTMNCVTLLIWGLFDNKWFLPGSVAYIRIYYAYIMWFSSLVIRHNHQRQMKMNFLCVHLLVEVFQFVSRRHQGFPFSLTFFLNGLQVDRLSSCCEFKHRKGSRLGGRHGHFGFCGVEGASPCYK